MTSSAAALEKLATHLSHDLWPDRTVEMISDETREKAQRRRTTAPVLEPDSKTA